MSVSRPSVNGAAVPPFMELSDGSSTSKTAAAPLSKDIPPAERARFRFAVKGNAIVTGGAGDIGSVACRALLEHGLQGLAIFDIHPHEGEKVARELREDFPKSKILFIQVNVTDEVSVNQAVAKAEYTFGGQINLTLCCAGITNAVHALDLCPENWKRMFDVNMSGAWLVAQAAAKGMAKGDGGSIILMSSISAHIVNFPQPQVHYNASKAALISIKSSLAAEWARYGIRVNTVSPGYMDTILNEGETLEEHRRAWAGRIPCGRMGQPEELTGAIILLASQAGSYITGADILVDGGITVF